MGDEAHGDIHGILRVISQRTKVNILWAMAPSIIIAHACLRQSLCSLTQPQVGQDGVLVIKIDKLVGNLLLENLIGPFIIQEIITQTRKNGEHYIANQTNRQV